jgi:hypothetical protein
MLCIRGGFAKSSRSRAREWFDKLTPTSVIVTLSLSKGRIWTFSEVVYFHDPFPMRFRAERMIPAISSR